MSNFAYVTFAMNDKNRNMKIATREMEMFEGNSFIPNSVSNYTQKSNLNSGFMHIIL